MSKDTPVLVWATLDRATSSAILTRSDGKQAKFPLKKSPFGSSSRLARIHFAYRLNALVAETERGDSIAFELPKYGVADGEASLQRRLVVYLDQNQWSFLDNALHASANREEENKAARQLVQWVEQRKIVLPVSAGHFTETAKRYDEAKRYRLALTILQQSRGWQMLDPLAVRRREVANAIFQRIGRGRESQDLQVFSLAPNVIYAGRDTTLYSAPEHFPADAALLLEALTSATAQIDALLDADRVEPGPHARWAEVNQRFTNWLATEEGDAQQKRKAVHGVLLADLQREIAEVGYAAGMSLEQMSLWLSKQARHDVPKMGMLGVYQELLVDRHLNKRTTWKSNDLTDMIYLSCATGYSDYVVTERHMGALLKQAVSRLKLDTVITCTLIDVVERIGQRLAT